MRRGWSESVAALLLALSLAALAAAGCGGGDASPAPPAAANCRALTLRVDGTGERVVGIEDLAVDAAAGVLYLSAYDRRTLARQVAAGAPRLVQGGIFALPLASLAEGGPLAVGELSGPLRGAGDFHPHGIALLATGPGSGVLFVINRSHARRDGEWRMTPQVEVFDVRAGSLRRRRDGVFADPQLCAPNDLAALDEQRFLVTNDHGACAGAGRRIEDALGLARSHVLYYDGARFRRVVDGIDFANGIAVTAAPDPSRAAAGGEPARLYVSATRGRGIHVYDLQAALREDSPATRPLALIRAGSGLDNLQWGQDGRLYAAGHPSLAGFAWYRWGMASRSPSRVVRADVRGPGDPLPEEVYAGDGALLSGATVATMAGGRLIAGGAFDDRLLVCDL